LVIVDVDDVDDVIIERVKGLYVQAMQNIIYGREKHEKNRIVKKKNKGTVLLLCLNLSDLGGGPIRSVKTPASITVRVDEVYAIISHHEKLTAHGEMRLCEVYWYTYP